MEKKKIFSLSVALKLTFMCIFLDPFLANIFLFSHSVVSNSATSWTAVHQVSLSSTLSWSLFRLMSIESGKPSRHHPSLHPSPLAFNLSQHQGILQWVISSHQVAKVLELQLEASVFPINIQGWFPLRLTCLNSLLSKGL